MSDEPSSSPGASRATARPTSGLLRPTTRNMSTCSTRTTKYVTPKSTPYWPKASGAASAVRNIAPMAASSTKRASPSSASVVVPIHTYATHAHHSTVSTAMPRSSPSQVGSAAINAVTWVSANTKTRSKNSSSAVTRRCSVAGSATLTRRTLAGAGTSGDPTAPREPAGVGRHRDFEGPAVAIMAPVIPRRPALAAALGGAVLASLVPAASAVAMPAPAHSALARTLVAEAPDRVAAVGDSLLVGTLIYGDPSYLRRAVDAAGLRLSPRPSAEVGRTVTEGLRVLGDLDRLPSSVLVELGTNNWRCGPAHTARWIARARAIVGPDRDVYWVNLRMTGRRYAAHRRVNTALVRGAATDATLQRAVGADGRTYVLDWHRYSLAVGVRPGRDGMHYGPSGYAVLARFIAGSLAGQAAYRPFLVAPPEDTIPMTPVPS